ncbi:MAG: universal stress protein [Haloplanus sp.]
MPQKVLVPVDESEQAKKALDYAIETHGEGDITLLHVLSVPSRIHPLRKSGYEGIEQVVEDAKEDAEQLLGELQSRAAEQGVDVTTDTAQGSVAKEIVAYAEEGDFDLIVIGSHGRSGASRVLLGSVAESVARRSSLPVVIQR